MFLAQLMGPILLILGISFALRRDEYMAWFKKIDKEGPYLFIQGVVEATAGLAVVLAHNLWTSPIEVFVSLLGWGMLLEGGLTLLSSKRTLKSALKSFATPQLMLLTTVFILGLGTFFTWVGYFLV